MYAIILFPPNKSWKLELVRSSPTVPILFSCFNSNNHDIPTSTLLNFAYVPKATGLTNRKPFLFVSSMMSWFPKASDVNTGFEGARYNYSQICIKISVFGRKKSSYRIFRKGFRFRHCFRAQNAVKQICSLQCFLLSVDYSMNLLRTTQLRKRHSETHWPIAINLRIFINAFPSAIRLQALFRIIFIPLTKTTHSWYSMVYCFFFSFFMAKIVFKPPVACIPVLLLDMDNIVAEVDIIWTRNQKEY